MSDKCLHHLAYFEVHIKSKLSNNSMYKISVDCTFTILVFLSENMKSVNIIFSLLINFTIYQQSVSKPILENSNSISKVVNDIEHIQYDIDSFEKKDRIKRQYYYGSHLGPISFDSIESDTPPPGYESDERSGDDSYQYAKPDTTTTTVKSRDIELISITTSSPDEENIEEAKEEEVADIVNLPTSPEITDVESHNYPPSTSYGVPIITNVNTEIKPNDELISIAEDHIKNSDGKKATSTSGKSNTVTKEKHEEKVPKTITSYGVPLSSVHGYPPYEIAQDESNDEEETNTANKPPASSYGVPYDKIFPLPKEMSKEVEIPKDNSKKQEEAKPYDLISSSYGVPLKSVTTLSNDTSIESIGVPDPKIKQKFKPDGEAKSNSHDDSNTVSSKKFIMMSVDDYEMINVCIEKSLTSVYSLNRDGTLVKDSHK